MRSLRYFSDVFRKLSTAFMLPAAIPVVLLVRLLRPWILIRFGILKSERIGHFTANTEYYLCERDLDTSKKKIFDLFFYNPVVSNRYLKKMWDRVLYTSPFARALFKANRWFPGTDIHHIEITRTSGKDYRGLLDQVPPHLSFTDAEMREGNAFLKKVGLGPDDSWVCFSSRDPAYLRKTFSGEDWSYHDYRNSQIENYFPAMIAMVDSGKFAFRMGAIVQKPIDLNHPKVIDYASHYRTEFLDIFLSAHCRFFVASTEGLMVTPALFRRPVLHVNHIPMADLGDWQRDHLVTPKKIWSRSENRFWNFSEVLALEKNRFLTSEDYLSRQLEPMENTPDEILDAVIEMDMRLQGKWQDSDTDLRLQSEFWELFKNPAAEMHTVRPCRVATTFLRANKDLIR